MSPGIRNWATLDDLRALGMRIPRPRRRRDLSGLTIEQRAIEEECDLEEKLSAKVAAFVKKWRENHFDIRGYHTRDSRKSHAGKPDWDIVLPGYQYVLELKVWPNDTTPDQDDWLRLYATLPNCTAAVVYPKDWLAIADDIERRLLATYF